MSWTYNQIYQRATSSRIYVPELGRLTKDDAVILSQAAEVYREFGEEGLRKFYDEMIARGKPEPCSHDRLTEEGQCRQCGEDRRGI